MALKDELEAARKDIKTDSYPISIRELASLYKERELDILQNFNGFFDGLPIRKQNLSNQSFLEYRSLQCSFFSVRMEF